MGLGGKKMKLHELKIKAQYYLDIVIGGKTFEIRKDDRDYKVGDLIKFNVIQTEKDKEDDVFQYHVIPFCLSSKDKVFQITYILRDVPEYGLDKDYCILGIKELVQR